MPTVQPTGSSSGFTVRHSAPPVYSRREALGWAALWAAIFILPGCAPKLANGRTDGAPAKPRVIATESFLADIAQNVAGDRLNVDTLVPRGIDPHSFEPTTADAARVASADVVIANGAGLESYLAKVLAGVGGNRQVVEASAGLKPRSRTGSEAPPDPGEEQDPHFWLDPIAVVQYADNIAGGLTKVDPDGTSTYRANADAYAARLRELDSWIKQQVSSVPPEHRLLVTNHESFGYFADRYGFKVIGTVLPGSGTEAMPSARDMAELTQRIRQTGARAIFLETGSSPQLAQAIGREAGVNVVTDLHTHSLTEATGATPTYIDMMRYNTRVIVDALR